MSAPVIILRIRSNGRKKGEQVRMVSLYFLLEYCNEKYHQIWKV